MSREFDIDPAEPPARDDSGAPRVPDNRTTILVRPFVDEARLRVSAYRYAQHLARPRRSRARTDREA